MGTIMVILIVIIIVCVIIIGLTDKVIKKEEESINQRNNEYQDKLENWCNDNNVFFIENISNWSEKWVNSIPGYVWFSNKDFVFCPDAINCGDPINIDENIIFIKYEDIKYYTKDGSVNYTNQIVNNGKNISISGAVIGGLIAGEAGAVIGSRKDMNKFENVTVKHDEVYTYIYYECNGDIKMLDVQGKDFYESILHRIPEKEYYYLLNRNNIN